MSAKKKNSKQTYLERKPIAVKNIRLKWILTAAGAVFLIITAIFLILHFVHSKPRAAFYRMPESTRNAIEQELQQKGKLKNDPFSVIVYDDSKSLAENVKGKSADIVFTYNGSDTESALKLAHKKSGVDPSALTGMISSARSTALINEAKKVAAVPLLLDNSELLVANSVVMQNGITDEKVFSWTEMNRMIRASQKKYMYPVVFAGGDDYSLVTIAGALIESFSGTTSWIAAAQAVKANIAAGKTSQAEFETLIKQLGGESQPLYNPLLLLNSWYKDKVISPETFNMKFTDVTAYLDNNLSAFALITLSDHRTVPLTTITNFSSFFYPAEPADRARNFTAPEIMVVPLTKNKKGTLAITRLASMGQEALSRGTGLAPVQAEARVPDRQADDVRYWIAASGEPLPSFAAEAFTTSADLHAFAEALRSCAKYR